MRLLTVDAVLKCAHMGVVTNQLSQEWVTIAERPVMVEVDPEGREISRCPNRYPGIKPCTLTLPVRQGYSAFIRIGGVRVCLDNLWGMTDGTPPLTVKYLVTEPGQQFVDGAA